MTELRVWKSPLKLKPGLSGARFELQRGFGRWKQTADSSLVLAASRLRTARNDNGGWATSPLRRARNDKVRCWSDCRPSGTWFFFWGLPRTYVRGYSMPPLRGWG